MDNIIYYFFSYIITLSTSYFLGNFIIHLSKVRSYNSSSRIVEFAEKTLIGITVLTAAIAILRTNGITTQSILILFILAYIFIFRKKDKSLYISFISLKETLLYLSISIFVFLFHWFLFYHLHDHVFYAKLGKAIYENGNESWSALYSSYKPAKGVMLYHYSDMWLGEFLSKLIHNNSLFCLTKIIYPIYHFISFIIILGITQEKKISIYFSIIISTSIWLGSAVLCAQILTTSEGHQTFWHYGFPEVTSFKSLVIYPYLFLAMYSLQNNNIYLFLFYSVISCLEYFTLFIAIFPACNIIILYISIFKKGYTIKKYIKQVILLNTPLILMILLPLIFKDVYNSNSSFSNLKNVILPIKEYLFNWKQNIEIFKKYFLRAFYLYPIVTILLIINLKKIKLSLLFLLSTLLFSTLFIVIFYNLTNSVQTMSILIGPLMLIICTYSFLFVENKIVFNSLFTLLIVTSILNILKINSLNNGNYKLIGFNKKIYTFSSEHLKNKNWAYYSTHPWSSWMYSSQIINSSLSLPNETKLGLEIAPFFNSDFEKYKKINKDSPICKIDHNLNSLLNLLKKSKINYLYIENSTLVNPLFKKNLTCIIKNGNSGIYQLINSNNN